MTDWQSENKYRGGADAPVNSMCPCLHVETHAGWLMPAIPDHGCDARASRVRCVGSQHTREFQKSIQPTPKNEALEPISHNVCRDSSWASKFLSRSAETGKSLRIIRSGSPCVNGLKAGVREFPAIALPEFSTQANVPLFHTAPQKSLSRSHSGNIASTSSPVSTPENSRRWYASCSTGV